MKYQVNENNIITGIFYDQDTETVVDTNVNFGLDRYIGGQVVRASELEVAAQKTKAEGILQNRQSSHALNDWFKWYDNQVLQAQRAQRTAAMWQANDGTKTYYTLSELDTEANAKQAQIRALKAQLQN